MADPTPYVAREADLEALYTHYTATRAGGMRTVLLEAPVGGGKRALCAELGRKATAEDDDVLLWRVAMSDEEDGLKTLLRIYAALFAGLHRAPTLRGKVEMALNSMLPSQPKRVQEWYSSFVDGVKKGAPKPGDQQFQVTLPRDNPLLGLVEIATGIARKFSVILDIQNAHICQSISFAAFLEALSTEAKDTRLMVVLATEPLDEAARTWVSRPFLDYLDRNEKDVHRLRPAAWGEEEVGRYLASKGLKGNAARLAEIAQGRPGYVAELADHFAEKGLLDSDLAGLTLGSVADATPDADELEEAEEAEEGKGARKHAGAADAERIAYVAALLGVTFPSGLVADMTGYDRDSVDDLLDATEDLYKEVQFSQGMGTWIYQFRRAIFRESVIARHTAEEDHEVARRVGMFLERFFVPRGYEFIGKALRLYGEHAAPARANLLRGMAMAGDPLQVWGMTQDLLKYFDEVPWPDAMVRTVYVNLLDRLVQGGDVNQTEGLYNQAMQWAASHQDRALQAWLLFAGSRLDLRRQDLYRARDRANDALKMFKALDDKQRQAETHAHLALIELQDGNPNAALEQAKSAEELSDAPGIHAHGEYVRGLVAQRERKLPAAVDHFKKANEIAGNAGQAALALEAGFHYGEALLMMGQHSTAADVLQRVIQIARGIHNPVRERSATALLAQAHAALKNFEAALNQANRTLELTRALKFKRLEGVDLFNVGLFNMMLGRTTEAVSVFKQSRAVADSNDGNLQKELQFHLGSALLQIGEKTGAEEALRLALKHSEAAKDWRKVVSASAQLADLEAGRGNATAARGLLDRALKAAEKGDLKELRKDLRRKLDALGA